MVEQVITYSIIQKSKLESAHRLDAEYYQPEYLELEKRIYSTSAYKLWGNIEGRFITGPFGSEFGVENYTSETQYRYIRGKDVKEFFLLNNDNVYIPEKDYERLKKYSLRESDILVSVVGTLGNAAIADSSVVPAIFSCKSTVFRTNSINPYYFIAYLNSIYGYKLLVRSVRGAVQTGLNIDDLKSLPVFIPSQKEQESIASLVLNAKQELNKSKLLYYQAEDLLLEKLGLNNFKPEEELSYIVNLSDVKSAHRADSEYFQPKYEKIFNFIKIPICQLGELIKFLNHAKQPPYVDNGKIPIITQKHLGRAFLNLEFINDSGTKFTSNEWIKKYPLYKLKLGDVLYYSVGAYIGKTNIVLEDLNATAASFITIIRPKEELNPIYLIVVLNSVIGKLQSEKWQSATAQQYIYPKDIKNFKIPIFHQSTQQKIADLVQQSHQARKKAKELLEKAKKEVEEFIEGKKHQR